jgi:integrase
MPTIKIGSITCIVKGYIVNNNLPYFRKAVPLALRERLGKTAITIPLKPENGHVAVQCQRLTQAYGALFKAMSLDASLTPSETKLAALALLQTQGLKPGDGLIEQQIPPDWKGSWDPAPHLSFFEDMLRDTFDQRTAVTDAAFDALYNKLPVLLSEAFVVYLENHQKGQDRKFQEAQHQHWSKLVALTGDISLAGLTREHARQYRDHRILQGVRTASVQREIAVIKAVINVAAREIPLNIKNPFDSLTIQNMNEDSVGRQPYSHQEIQILIEAAAEKDDEKRRIVIVLALTGARLAEIVGLRKQDVDIAAATIHIRHHATRAVKTAASERVVPLLSYAMAAVQKQMAESSTEFLFPSYANTGQTNSDSASAALNKWAKNIVAGKSMHSFRHSMRDELRAVMCPETMAKEIGGWSSKNDVSVGYGQGYPLELKREWLAKAYGWLKHDDSSAIGAPLEDS